MSAQRQMRRTVAATAALAAVTALAGCTAANEQQSILNPQGPRAEAVHGLWVLMLIIGVVVWVIVVVAMVVPLLRRRRKSAQAKDLEHDGGVPAGGGDADGGSGFGRDDGGRRALWVVALSGAVIPAVVITAVVVLSTVVLQDIDPAGAEEGTSIEVTGHQFWWEIRYPDLEVVTANEIHIPVGERVSVEVTAEDVIHSFWVPELSGKIDMIPGRANQIWLEADEPGTYWGQCAEFCGAQHAKMRFVVVAHEQAEFDGWVAGQQEPARMPVAEGQTGAGGEAAPGAEAPAEGEGAAAGEEPDAIARGREVFLSSSCVYCHTVAGTPATGELGPDLTHLASRDTLAAGVLQNNRGNLAGWILDPQSIKPGNLMPGTDIDGDDLQSLLTYLESLE